MQKLSWRFVITYIIDELLIFKTFWFYQAIEVYSANYTARLAIGYQQLMEAYQSGAKLTDELINSWLPEYDLSV